MKRNTRIIQRFLLKTGLSITPKKLTIISMSIAAIIALASAIFYSIELLPSGTPILFYFFIIPLAFLVSFVVSLFGIWLVIYLALDIMVFKRHLEIEEVLPDYLQLTAANLRAGMTPDQALWNAVRPQFGVLSKEIEVVAKETYAGRALTDSLNDFSLRYESKLLRYAINLINEGLEAGSELSDILNKVAVSIQEARILQKEMAANVNSYAIFIGAAVLFGSPLLLALAQQILGVMAALTAGISIPSNVQASFFSISGGGISPRDFQIFSYVMIGITSTMSALIISMIMKGNIKEGARYILFFVPGALLTFFVFSWFFGKLVGSIIQLG